MAKSQEGKSQKADLKQLRQEHAETVAITQQMLKEQQSIRKQINAELSEQARTVPDLAQAIDLPADRVLWHLMAMKKYGLVQESDMDGQYYLYQTVKE
jgi:predicted transcriptional regulator